MSLLISQLAFYCCYDPFSAKKSTPVFIYTVRRNNYMTFTLIYSKWRKDGTKRKRANAIYLTSTLWYSISSIYSSLRVKFITWHIQVTHSSYEFVYCSIWPGAKRKKNKGHNPKQHILYMIIHDAILLFIWYAMWLRRWEWWDFTQRQEWLDHLALQHASKEM